MNLDFAQGHFAGGAASNAGEINGSRRDGEAVEQVRALGDGAMAGAAAADLVPAGILADDIDDRGGDSSALREAFAAY
jgi:hypothetical protein